MVINDRIYGQQEIKEPVIQKLINSKPLTRLQYINQAGPSKYLYPWKTISRFEHSLGVMMLLKMFGASVEEQIAGLLHDVPHTAFSHVADFVFTNEQHEYHELFHEEVINKSEIPDILRAYGISLRVIHPEKFSLLERKIPDLCADRIDYALRDFMAWKHDEERVKFKLQGLTVFKKEFVFTNIESAELFARDYLTIDEASWANPLEAAVYELMAQAIAHALDKKILTHSDLFSDDETVMTLLRDRGDAFIQKKLAYLTPSFRIEPASQAHHQLFVKTKVRVVDPKIKQGNTLTRLSQLSGEYKKLMERHTKRGSAGWYVDIYRS